jgi:hypothetical protein
MRRSREPQNIIFVVFKIALIAALLSPALVGAILPISFPQYLLVGVLSPIYYFALDYWRTIPAARLNPRWTALIGAIAIVLATYIVAHGEHWLATPLLARGAVFGLLVLIPIALIRDALRCWRAWRPDEN